MNYITRSIEKRLCSAEKAFKAVLLTGARQTGKSTMLRKLFPDRKYVTFDDPFIEEQARDSTNMFMSLNRPPIIFDEVQRVPDLFRYIKIQCDESEERGLYCLSGSQPFRLMKNVSESLSGRVRVIEMSALSLREIQGDPFDRPFLPTMEYLMERQKTVKKPDNIWEIIHRGGYPEMYGNPNMDWQAFYASYVKTYLERDVRELSAVQDLDTFRRFMIAAAARTGQMLNYSNIADEISKDVGTVKNWMSILETSGIIYLLEPYMPAVLKRAIKTPKVYFRDTGLAAYLTRWMTPETLAVGAMSGAMFETFVISEILKSYSNQGIDYRYCVSYYRGKDKKRVRPDGQETQVESEIDLIIEENGRKRALTSLKFSAPPAPYPSPRPYRRGLFLSIVKFSTLTTLSPKTFFRRSRYRCIRRRVKAGSQAGSCHFRIRSRSVKMYRCFRSSRTAAEAARSKKYRIHYHCIHSS